MRAPRARLAAAPPAVLRFPDGQRAAGNLQVVSLTGGLLLLPNPLNQGSQVKLMFLTGAGSVLGGAEMLNPVATNLQPFRFTSLGVDDQRRLGVTIQSVLYPDNGEQAWMKKLREASFETGPARGRRFRRVAAGLMAFGLVITLYLLQTHWLR